MILKLYTYFGLDSTRGQYYNVYIPTGDAQKEKYHVRRPAGTGKMTEKETYVLQEEHYGRIIHCDCR